MDIPQFLGVLEDTRPPERKILDRSFVEFVTSAAPVVWKEKQKKDWRKFSDQNQDGSGSCVMQTIRKLASIQMFLKEGQYVEMSAGFYKLRSNKPASGMIGIDAFDIWKNYGVPLEVLVESDNKSDAQMDAIELPQYKMDIAKSFAISGHAGIPVGDFETVASVIQQTGKGVMAWFYFNLDEWSKEVPEVLRPLQLYGGLDSRHSVAVVDFGLINGKKYLKIEDSAHFGGLTERWISEEFFAARNFFTRYASSFKFDEPLNGQKPFHVFTKTLEFIPLDSRGMISDLAKHEAQKEDVKKLQDILKFEGLFPTNVESTGYYGAMTAKGVYGYQVEHLIAPLPELDSITPKGGRVGSKTITNLNFNYGQV